MNDLDELIHWFTGRELPTSPLRISGWETTPDLAYAVEMAIAGARNGSATSKDLLNRIRLKLTSTVEQADS